jgi:hypothetical protein
MGIENCGLIGKGLYLLAFYEPPSCLQEFAESPVHHFNGKDWEPLEELKFRSISTLM